MYEHKEMNQQPLTLHERHDEGHNPERDSRRDHHLPLSPSPIHLMSQSRQRRRSKRTKDLMKHVSRIKLNSKASGEKAAAMTAAVYYGDCYVEGISADIANEAAKESHSRFKKWWLQEPCCEGRLMSSLGDAYAVPLFNPPPNPPDHTLEDTEYRTSRKSFKSQDNDRISSPSKFATRDSNGDQYCDEMYYAVDDADIKLGGDVNTIASRIFENGMIEKYKTTNRKEILSPKHEKERKENKHEYKNPPNTLIAWHSPQNNTTMDRKRKVEVPGTPEDHNGGGSCKILQKNVPIERRQTTEKDVQNARRSFLHALTQSSGDVTTENVLLALNQLRIIYNMTGWDARDPVGVMRGESTIHIEGTWVTLSRPHFQECLGKNSMGDYMYTLGRMSFDMFYPADLVCSIQGIFNQVETVNLKDRKILRNVPKSLRDELKTKVNVLRRYK